jgi:hypothetical protein
LGENETTDIDAIKVLEINGPSNENLKVFFDPYQNFGNGKLLINRIN